MSRDDHCERYDCLVWGEACLDLPVRPVRLDRPLQDEAFFPVESIQPRGGGIVSNSGLALARLGMRTAAFALVGDDLWGDFLKRHYTEHGLDATHLLRRSDAATSTTVILIDESGEHTFAYHGGASTRLDAATVLAHLDLFARADYALLGYYALLPQLEKHLDRVLPAIRETGCRLAMDTAGGGGSLSPLAQILPHLDYYVPSYDEAVQQTGKQKPADILAEYRRYTRRTMLGVKLGERGALFCPIASELIRIVPVDPPGEVVDTTGAGDCFYAGLIAGLQRGLSLEQAGRLAASAGACSVTQVGAVAGLRSYEQTRELARL